MSKYNLTDILNEYVGGSKIGTLNISFKELSDKMEDIEMGGDYIVRRLEGPSGDGKVNREFEVVDREDVVEDGDKQEKGFTVYDYKFGFDPGDQDHYMDEYEFSVGGSNIALAQELLGAVPYSINEDFSREKSKTNWKDPDWYKDTFADFNIEQLKVVNDMIKKARKLPGAMDRVAQMAKGKNFKDRIQKLIDKGYKPDYRPEPDYEWDAEVDLAREGKSKEEIDESKDWIQKAIKRPGALHRELGVPLDKDIPKWKMDAAEDRLEDEEERDHEAGRDMTASDRRELRQIDLAKTLEKFTEAKDWIQKAIKRPGALHRALDIPRDEDIPHSLINKDIRKMDDLEAEEGHLDKRDLRFLRQLDLAKTLEKFNENKEPGKLTAIEDVINTLGDDDLEKIVAYMKERGRLTETVDEDIWVMAEKAVTHLGADQFAEALVRAMSTDDAKLYITGILKDWEIPMDDEDYSKYLNESLEESVVKNMITLLSDYGTESEINTYMDSVGREFMINPTSVEDYSDFSDDDWVEDFREWINDKYEDVREHFNRFK